MITAIYLWTRKGNVDENIIIAGMVDCVIVIATYVFIYNVILTLYGQGC